MIFIVEHGAVFDQDGEILTPCHCMRRNYFKSAVVADQTQGIHRAKSLQKINYFPQQNKNIFSDLVTVLDPGCPRVCKREHCSRLTILR